MPGSVATSHPQRGGTSEMIERVGQGVVRLARRHAFAAALILLYVYTFPYFEGIRSANELPRIYLAMAIVDRGALDIGPEMWRYQASPDTSHFEGKYYSNKAPGLSLLAAPIYGLHKLLAGTTPELTRVFFWLRFFCCTVPSLLFLWLLWRFLGELLPHKGTRRLVLAAYGLGTMALVYGTQLIGHQLSAILVGTAFILVFLGARRPTGISSGRATLAGLAAGAAVLVDYQTAFIGPPLFLYLLWRAPRKIRSALLFGAGAAIPLGALLLYHWHCFGDPFSTPYRHLTHPVFQHWVNQGFFGIVEFKRSAFIDRHLSADDGLFYYSPFLLAALPGLLVMLARRALRAEALFCGLVIAFYAYFIAALVLISGWDVGPRYVICALPFYLPPIAALASSLEQRWHLRAVLAGLMAVSIIIYLAVSSVFPHFPDNFSQPLFDVTLRFAGAEYLPYNLGWLFGLSGLPSVLPLAVIAAALLLNLLAAQTGPGHRSRTRRPLHVIAKRAGLTMAALVVAAMVLFLHYERLADRGKPLPERFIPWMERIWEPRHDRMKPAALLRPIGPRGNEWTPRAR